MKVSSFIIIALICYIIAVGYNVLTVSNIAEEKIQQNSLAIGIEVASRLGIGQTIQIFGNFMTNPGNASSIFQDERVIRELASVMMDWYAPIKFSPVLSVSKEVYILLVQNRIKPSASGSASGSYAYVSSDALNVRSGPSANHAIVGRLSRNTRVEIINRSGTWWRIRSGNIGVRQFSIS